MSVAVFNAALKLLLFQTRSRTPIKFGFCIYATAGIYRDCCATRKVKTTEGEGVGALRDLLGLAEYIGRAEVKKMEFHDAPEKSPQLFEKLLPYAIALNLTSIWTKQFEGMLEQPPEWYAGASPVFSGYLFALSVMHLSSGMERTFVSAPRTSSSGRSAWGGGSGFGGGFSGGGFGGGGW